MPFYEDITEDNDNYYLRDEKAAKIRFHTFIKYKKKTYAQGEAQITSYNIKHIIRFCTLFRPIEVINPCKYCPCNRHHQYNADQALCFLTK